VRPTCGTALCCARAAALFALMLHEQQHPQHTISHGLQCTLLDCSESAAKLTVSAFCLMPCAQTQLQAANEPVEVETSGGGFEDSRHLVVVSV
jgi:hypothetical protein